MSASRMRSSISSGKSGARTEAGFVTILSEKDDESSVPSKSLPSAKGR